MVKIFHVHGGRKGNAQTYGCGPCFTTFGLFQVAFANSRGTKGTKVRGVMQNGMDLLMFFLLVCFEFAS
jgi:hypothetical protein